MDINLTTIVGLLGVSAVLIFGFKDKLSGILLAKKAVHKKEQDKIEKEVIVVKQDITKKEEEIKQLQEKTKVAEKIVQEINNSTNEEVKKILKEENVGKLINEFNKW